MEEIQETICRFCGLAAPADAYFCPHCGKTLREKPQSTSVFQQIVAYSVSLFLPPFGLWYAWKYWQQDDQKSKQIAIAVVVLTLISVIVTIWVAEAVISSVNQSLGGILPISP